MHLNTPRHCTQLKERSARFTACAGRVTSHEANLCCRCVLSLPCPALLSTCQPIVRSLQNRQRRLCTSASAQPVSTRSVVGTAVKAADGKDFKWGSFLSNKPTVPSAIAEAVKAITSSVAGDFEPDLALVFVSSGYGPDLDNVVSELRKQAPSLQNIFGCTVSGKLQGVQTQLAITKLVMQPT